MSYADQLQALRPARPLQLMPSGGSGTATPAVQLYEDVTPTSVGDRSTVDLLGMTLGDFADYVDSQADWHLTPGLGEDEMGELRTLQAFALDSESNREACGGMAIADLRALGLTRENFSLLAAYSRAHTKAVPTAEVAETDDPAVAQSWGEGLVAVEAVLSGVVLKTIMPGRVFAQLNDAGLVPQFVNYTQLCQPNYHAADGDEIRSFMAFIVEGANPADYHSQLDRVHNYHRFMKDALDQLVTNEGGNTSNLPFTLILHSAFCHNGAFHRQQDITDVITNGQIFTLMIEGAESLADITAQITPLAQAYGQGGFIDQVLIAGHGFPQTVQLAGTVVEEEGRLRVQHERLNVSGNSQASEDLLNEVINNMGVTDLDAPNRRIVLNACLGNAQTFGGLELDADPNIARQQIRDHIAANPSTRTFIENMAIASGRGDMVVLGASGSTLSGDIDLIDEHTGELIHESLGADEAIIAPKIQYVERGTELLGVLLAAIECFADPGPDKLARTMRRRLRRTEGTADFDIGLIRAVFDVFANEHPENASMLQRLARLAQTVSAVEGGSTSTSRVQTMMDLTPSDDAETFWSNLAGLDDFDGNLLLLGLQVWVFFSDTPVPDLLAELESRDCSVANRIHAPAFEPRLPLLLPLPPNPSPSDAEMVLALILAKKAGNAHALQFLDTLLGTADRFPPSLDVEGLLDDFATEAEILTLLGRTPPAEPAPQPPDANVDLDGDGQNDFRIEPMSAVATVTARSTGARHRPHHSEDSYSRPRRGTEWNVIGSYGRWYAIEYPDAPGGTAFLRAPAVSISR